MPKFKGLRWKKNEFGRWFVVIYEVWVITIFDEKMIAAWFQQIIKIEPLGAHGWVFEILGGFENTCFFLWVFELTKIVPPLGSPQMYSLACDATRDVSVFRPLRVLFWACCVRAWVCAGALAYLSVECVNTSSQMIIHSAWSRPRMCSKPCNSTRPFFRRVSQVPSPRILVILSIIGAHSVSIRSYIGRVYVCVRACAWAFVYTMMLMRMGACVKLGLPVLYPGELGWSVWNWDCPVAQ